MKRVCRDAINRVQAWNLYQQIIAADVRSKCRDAIYCVQAWDLYQQIIAADVRSTCRDAIYRVQAPVPCAPGWTR